MKRTGLLILIGLIFYCAVSWGQEIYQWVDGKGTLHFTDDLSLVPERYRNQVQKKKSPKEPSPPLSPQVDQSDETERKFEPPPEQKDLMGRGEEWWRTKAEEWSEKLLNANKNYDTAYTAWKTKEKELEQSKLKPKSFQRKLKTEIKVLEGKAKEWEKQREEAKNMLEKVLPKEAEESKADPDWIKIEK
jgi:hypothetical protein